MTRRSFAGMILVVTLAADAGAQSKKVDRWVPFWQPANASQPVSIDVLTLRVDPKTSYATFWTKHPEANGESSLYRWNMYFNTGKSRIVEQVMYTASNEVKKTISRPDEPWLEPAPETLAEALWHVVKELASEKAGK